MIMVAVISVAKLCSGTHKWFAGLKKICLTGFLCTGYGGIRRVRGYGMVYNMEYGYGICLRFTWASGSPNILIDHPFLFPPKHTFSDKILFPHIFLGCRDYLRSV